MTNVGSFSASQMFALDVRENPLANVNLVIGANTATIHLMVSVDNIVVVTVISTMEFEARLHSKYINWS